jgi:hypothetical protein
LSSKKFFLKFHKIFLCYFAPQILGYRFSVKSVSVVLYLGHITVKSLALTVKSLALDSKINSFDSKIVSPTQQNQ